MPLYTGSDITADPHAGVRSELKPCVHFARVPDGDLSATEIGHGTPPSPQRPLLAPPPTRWPAVGSEPSQAGAELLALAQPSVLFVVVRRSQRKP